MIYKEGSMVNRWSRLLVPGIACLPLAISAAEEAGEHEVNEIAVFIGLTHENSENASSLGLEYERRFSDVLGLGVLAEKAWGDIDSWIYAVPLTLHAGEWKFIVAPGIEKKHGHTENLIRVGVGHEFETSNLKITPSLNVDFVNNETIYVLGVSFGKGF